MNKKVRIGIIGTGFARLVQIPAFQAAGAEIVSVGSGHLENARRAAHDFGVEHFTDDWREIVRREDLDLISIVTPPIFHHEMTMAALENGKHVLCEKPMAMNAAEAQRMLDAAQRAGKHLILGFQHRFEPRSKYLRDRIAAGDFGRILYVKAQALRRRGIPSWGQFGRKDVQGGGPLIDIGVHVLETAHYLMGSPRPVAASGSVFTYLGNQPCNALAQWGAWDHKTYTVEDLAVGQVRFDGGAVLSIETSFAAHIERDVFNIQVVGERAGANWETSQVFSDQCGYMVNSTASYIGEWPYFEYKVRHFVEVCRDGRPNEVPGEHGLMVQKILDALYASAEQGREVGIE